MNKYMVGNNIIGYDRVEIENWDFEGIKDSILIVSMGGEKVNLPKYYTCVKKMIAHGNKVILVSLEDDEQFKVLASLMASLGKYDIYKVEDRDTITAGYIEMLEERNPDYIETQSYIGADIASYANITEIIMTMENMIDDGHIQELKYYIEANKPAIDSMVATIDYLKKEADLSNSKMLVDRVEKLNNSIKEASENMDKAVKEKEEAVRLKDEAENAVNQAKAEKQALMSRVESLEEQAQNGTPAISFYSTVNMAYIKHKIQRVLYFKELSNVPYTMSMINSIYELLTNSRKLNVKFVIYDNSTEMYEQYVNNNMKIINSKNYSVNKPMLTGKQSCLVAEPNPAITNDLLQVPDGFDVLIIYDKMHRYEDLVTGNNVTRIIVSASGKELEAARKKLSITVSDMILTTKNSSIYENTELTNRENIVDIEDIEGYSQQTDSAKVAKYAKMTTSRGDKLLGKIFKVSNIATLF